MADIYSNPAEWFNLTDQFRDLNQQIIDLENLIRADPAVAQAISRDVLATRVQYNDAAERFITLYRAVFGEVPTGLTAPPVIAAWAVVSVAAIAGVVISIREVCATLRERARTAQVVAVEANRAALIEARNDATKRADQARAKGDKQGEQYWRQQAEQYGVQAGTPEVTPTETGDLSTWLEKNWYYVAAGGAAALYVVKAL